MPADIIEIIDDYCRATGISRSAYIEGAVYLRFNDDLSGALRMVSPTSAFKRVLEESHKYHNTKEKGNGPI